MSGFSESEYEEIRNLLRICEPEDFFSIEGEIFKGERVDLIKKYVKENPSKAFRIWLIDQGLRIN